MLTSCFIISTESLIHLERERERRGGGGGGVSNKLLLLYNRIKVGFTQWDLRWEVLSSYYTKLKPMSHELLKRCTLQITKW